MQKSFCSTGSVHLLLQPCKSHLGGYENRVMRFPTVLHQREHHTGLHACHHSAPATMGTLGLRIYANDVAAGPLLSKAEAKENKLKD